MNTTKIVIVATALAMSGMGRAEASLPPLDKLTIVKRNAAQFYYPRQARIVKISPSQVGCYMVNGYFVVCDIQPE